MTQKQKEAYVDAVIYLLQLARSNELDDYQRKFCLDVVEKAELLYSLKPHLFIERNMKEDIAFLIDKYTKDNRYNCIEEYKIDPNAQKVNGNGN